MCRRELHLDGILLILSASRTGRCYIDTDCERRLEQELSLKDCCCSAGKGWSEGRLCQLCPPENSGELINMKMAVTSYTISLPTLFQRLSIDCVMPVCHRLRIFASSLIDFVKMANVSQHLGHTGVSAILDSDWTATKYARVREHVSSCSWILIYSLHHISLSTPNEWKPSSLIQVVIRISHEFLLIFNSI